MIAVICLSVVVVVLIAVMALIVLKISKKSMRKDYNDSIGTASNLQIPAQMDGQVGVWFVWHFIITLSLIIKVQSIKLSKLYYILIK